VRISQHVEAAHAERALGRLAYHGEGLRQQRLQRLAVFQTLTELDGLGAERGVGERRHLRLQHIDARHHPLHFPDEARIAVADEFLEQVYNHLSISVQASNDRGPAGPFRNRDWRPTKAGLWRKSAAT
jgi:hypothetical protein